MCHSWVRTLSVKLDVVVSCRRFLIFLILAVAGGLFCPARLPAQTTKQTTKSASRKPAARPSQHKTGRKPAKKKASPRVRRIRQAFVASSELRPMARQLLQDRTPAAYAGVEAYARRHQGADAGSLAYLVLGYAHILDQDHAKAITPLTRAKAHAGDLGEYVSYYLGSAYLQMGRPEAIAELSDFDTKYPDSLLLRDAHVVYASALIQVGRAADAVKLLEKDRLPTRSDIEWNLGRAYEAAGESAKAAQIFRNLYLTMPLSGEADLASAELKKFSATDSKPFTVEERRARADLLMKGRRFASAADEFRALLDVVDAATRPALQLSLAVALERSGRDPDAKRVLDGLQGLSGEDSAQRLYLLAEVARSDDDSDGMVKVIAQLRQEAPSSPWLERALLSCGNMFLLKKDYDRAIDFYRELPQRFPDGSRSSYAHWKAAWLTLRQGRKEEAKKQFEEQIALYPSSNEVPAALYWRARLAQDEGDLIMARAFYQKLDARFRNYYYAGLARKELSALKGQHDLAHYPLLDRIPPIDFKADSTAPEVPSDNLRFQKAQLLGNGGLVDLAARELQIAAQEEREKNDWVAPETARLFQENQLYNRGIEVMKRAVPNYFAMDIPALPRTYWEALFPRPYWYDLKRFSARNELDPYLVASLIRQESEFNPGAVSNRNAVGLMQLLPKTGRVVARQERLRNFTPSQLLVPGVNMRLGTRYFKSMVEKFGSFEYALAAYNAGSDRVEDWLSAGNFRDPQEFVESIPFTETREYVQAILRNASVYRQLYGTP
jgi:soluble lytic murein transglycosylase